MTDLQAEDTPLPYPHAEPPQPPVLVYQRDGTALRTLAGGDITVEDAAVAYSELRSTGGARVRVSTSFLSIDASLGLLDTPLLFETVVAGHAGIATVQRYATEEEAMLGHLALFGQALRAFATPPAPPEPAAEAGR